MRKGVEKLSKQAVVKGLYASTYTYSATRIEHLQKKLQKTTK
jgi:hypothetical protein